MRKIGLIMNVLMGVSLSCVLSLVGLLSSGRFSLGAWLLSFGASTVLSLLIGFFLPVRKTAAALGAGAGLKERSLGFHFLDSLVSDVFYTPLITLLMVFLAYKGAQRGIAAAIASGAPADSVPALHFLPMFLHSLVISMVVGYVLIFILQPLYLKMLGVGKKHKEKAQN